MRHSVCATAILAAAVALVVSVMEEPPCQFSGGLGPDAACTQSRDDNDVTSPWLWPGDDGFGMGFGTPGYGWP